MHIKTMDTSYTIFRKCNKITMWRCSKENKVCRTLIHVNNNDPITIKELLLHPKIKIW